MKKYFFAGLFLLLPSKINTYLIISFFPMHERTLSKTDSLKSAPPFYPSSACHSRAARRSAFPRWDRLFLVAPSSSAKVFSWPSGTNSGS